MNDQRYEVVVIGAGQAGLAIGHFLGKQGGRFVVMEAAADQVVVATGPFQVPSVPALAGGRDEDVFQTHSTGYRRSADLPGGRVLVVGGANTGFQIAAEFAADGRAPKAAGATEGI